MPTEKRIMPSLTQPAKIGDNLEVDVIVDRETKFDSEVTENPVEDGFIIADHVNRKPMTLTMTVVFTPTPVSWYDKLGNNQNRMTEVANALQQIYKDGEPVKITLVDAIYDNMVMTSAPLPRNIENGYCYKMQLSFTHVRIVNQRTEEIPEDGTDEDASGKAGETEKDAGAASQTDIGTGMTTVDNTATVDVDTSAVDMSNSGNIATGKEMTAVATAQALQAALVSQVWR